ncbi:MAG: hypothetical protein ACOYNI_10645 [Acidimicrobiia bacterium]
MRKPFAVLSLALIAALGLSACGVKDAVDKVQKAGDNAQKQAEAFEARKKKAEASTYKVTYKKQEGASSETSEFTYAHQGKRSALKSDNELTIFDGDSKQVIICTDVDKKPSCTKTEGGSDDFLSLYGAGFFGGALTEFLTIVPGVDSKQFTKTIAGRDAECTEAKPGEFLGNKLGDPGDKFVSCYDKDTGVALFYESVQKGKTDYKIEATKFGQPSSSDFTPPAEAKTFDEQLSDATSTTRPRTTTTDSSSGTDSSSDSTDYTIEPPAMNSSSGDGTN